MEERKSQHRSELMMGFPGHLRMILMGTGAVPCTDSLPGFPAAAFTCSGLTACAALNVSGGFLDLCLSDCHT